MKWISTLGLVALLLTSCGRPAAQPTAAPVSTASPKADMPNPASVHCVEQGYRSEIRTAADGSQSGVCIFPDGSECDEWAYYRGECSPAGQSSPPAQILTAMPIDPGDYDQSWWTYTHPVYSFSIMLPEDWVVEEVTTNDPLMNHALNLRPREISPGVVAGQENVRLTFRRVDEDVLLWPTGVGQGEFIQQGTLDVAGQPALRCLLVCPTGEVTSIWYHQAEGQPNIARGDLEFGFIYSAGPHCEPGLGLSGKVQHVGEMIIASLKVP